MNLLEETLEDLKDYVKTTSDVKWVGSRDGALGMTWDDFAKIASVEYDAGYGSQEIAKDLVVVGHDWWLERSEYDGSERWTFQKRPVLADEYKPFDRVKNDDPWVTLKEIND